MPARVLPATEQADTLHAAVDWTNHGWNVNFGVGRGLTHNADNLTVKAIGGFPFRARAPSGPRGRWENASAGAAS